jgi:hypothetical protein
MNLYKFKTILIVLTFFSSVFTINIFAQFIDQFDFGSISASLNTREKPQSKAWYYGGYWWAVIPVSSGTYIYRLDGNTWTQTFSLTNSTGFEVDAKADGNVTHILLLDGDSTQLASVEYVSSFPPSYQFWTSRTSLVSIPLGSGVETATIDIDGTGKMWLAYNKETASTNFDDIKIMWSVSPYRIWSGPHLLKSNVDSDDLCAVTAFGANKIGVLWSNQVDNQFQFKYHLDSDPATTWSAMEEISGPVKNGSFADDHINLAVSSDGTIYAAIKTSYDTDSEITIGLLERENGGTWHVYDVTKSSGTRPIALLDIANNDIYVVYTESSISPGNIVYKHSSTSNISFSSLIELKAGSFNNVTSTKQNFTDAVVVLFSAGTTWSGVMAGTTLLPVELAYFVGNLNGNNIELRWRTETEVNNYGFDIERAKENADWLTIGFVEGNGNSNSPRQYSFIDSDIGLSGNYHYRLKQIDNGGTYEYSDVVSIEVGVPNNFYLSQNYPNPFNPETRIDFTLPEKQLVSLRIYNTLGELVGELVNEEKEAGNYSVTFDASKLPSGVYIYRLQTTSFAANNKMTLMK